MQQTFLIAWLLGILALEIRALTWLGLALLLIGLGRLIGEAAR